MVFSFTATILMSIDLHTTPNFRLRGSGVTHKQRILIAEAMTLCFYLAIGALIFIYLEDWTFLNALYVCHTFHQAVVDSYMLSVHKPLLTF